VIENNHYKDALRTAERLHTRVIALGALTLLFAHTPAPDLPSGDEIAQLIGALHAHLLHESSQLVQLLAGVDLPSLG
jgi:hypothetical protein